MPPSTGGDKPGVDEGGAEGQGVEERRPDPRESPRELQGGADHAKEPEESVMEQDGEGAARMVNGSPSAPREVSHEDAGYTDRPVAWRCTSVLDFPAGAGSDEPLGVESDHVGP